MDVSASQVTDLVLWWVRLACEMLGKLFQMTNQALVFSV